MSEHGAAHEHPGQGQHAGHSHSQDHGELGHGDGNHGGSAHADHGIAKYVYVFVALCVLTGASFFTYSDAWPFHDTPQVGWAFMMAVSCTKAMLVILFFMHVKYEASWKYVLTIPASIMSIFLILALVPDIGKRYAQVLGGRRLSNEQRLYLPPAEPAAEHSNQVEH